MARAKRIAPTRTERGVEIGPTDTSFGRRVTIINPSDRWPSVCHRRQHTFILAFGQVSATYLMVYADHLQDAFDECIDWLVDHAPGLLCDDEVAEEYERVFKEKYDEYLAAGKSEADAEEDARSEAWDQSEVDTSCGGNASNRIMSDHWTIVAEDLTRKELDEFLYPPDLKWKERTHCIDDGSRWHKCHHPVVREAYYPYTAKKPTLPYADNRCEVQTP